MADQLKELLKQQAALNLALAANDSAIVNKLVARLADKNTQALIADLQAAQDGLSPGVAKEHVGYMLTVLTNTPIALQQDKERIDALLTPAVDEKAAD